MRAHGVPTLWTAPMAALGLAVFLAPAAAAQPVSRHVQPQLVAEMESIRPGQRFWVALQLRMDPQWHTYWKNPGDSGLASRLTWKLPDGFAAEPIEWPYPRTFTQGPVTSYGYEGEVLLPVAITPPASLPAGTSVTLAARADWLECREACLPGRRELSLVLPVRAEAPRPDARWAEAFARTRRQMPEVATGWRFAMAEAAPRMVLSIEAPRAAGELRQARFFPEEPQLIDNAAPQALAKAGAGYRLELTPAPNAAKASALKGVLVYEGPAGTRAVRVETAAGSTRGRTTGGGGAPPSGTEDR